MVSTFPETGRVSPTILGPHTEMNGGDRKIYSVRPSNFSVIMQKNMDQPILIQMLKVPLTPIQTLKVRNRQGSRTRILKISPSLFVDLIFTTSSALSTSASYANLSFVPS